MHCSDLIKSYVLSCSDVRYWKSCVCLDIQEEVGLESGWIWAIDFARHRGIDVNLMLEQWNDAAIN